jgi:HAMP domain-containing protein/CheY-like chemotaxis protein/signal transduction histidine kinase
MRNTDPAKKPSSTPKTYTEEQLRPLLDALEAAKSGDFSARLPEFKNGVLSQIYKAFNQVIELNERHAEEIVRVGRLVGREGRMTERASVKGASGSWETSVQGINALIEDLARPTTEVARVITAVAEGDLTQKMALEIEGTPVKGEFLRIGTTVNTMVDQLGSFAAEVTRVAREVGTEGILGGQANVKGVSGTWKDLTDNVNLLAGNLTTQVRNIALVTTAVANGDLSQKITVDAKGEILELKNTVNTMVDQLGSFADEVTRVAREVGTEGILGGQAKVQGVSGTWKDLTDNVNLLAGNLTDQVRNIALVTTAVANGDLSQKITVDARGEVLELKNTVNTMVDQLNSFADEVTRVAREVGTEGILGGQAKVAGVSGTWKDLTDSVNFMASNLTTQVRGIAKVVTAVADGDLDQKLVLEAKGEVAALVDTINSMTDTLSTFADQVTTVAREVGTEGKLGGQAIVPNVAGTWKNLTDNVNFMASNLTTQVRGIARVVTAVANGDLKQTLDLEAKGEVAALVDTINSMTDTLSTFAEQVTSVAREVGTEGILGGQADVPGVAGTWKDLTDNVNLLAGNLTNQVRNIALVTTAVANGDLSQKITVDVKGEVLELKNTINTMVDQLNSFADEVTRVAREVGTEGILGGQANVQGVSGVWRDLTENVNFMATNLTDQVRNIALVTTAVANGDLSQKITVDAKGEILELKDTVNTMVDQLGSFADEVTRVAREVGTEGQLGVQAKVPGVSGTWKDLTDNVNLLAGNLTVQLRDVSKVATAIANGDLSQKITVDVKGEILQIKDVINTMVDQLGAFADEVTRVAREVGTEGKLGVQAKVPGVSGTWKDLTDNVNFMASNLTVQLRDVSKVATAIATGDLSQKITVDVKGEILQIKDVINTMVEQLGSFADEVTRVAREVGTEGKLGVQARVPGVSGTWKDLTDNVNFMASNLTDQVRSIALVTTAVANGDLSQKITVDVRGEILELKNTINKMVDQLGSFAAEVTRVAREVGTEGILGGQARVGGVSGIWKDLTDNVNFMASNLTTQVRGIVKVVTAVANGDLNQKLKVQAKGEVAALADTINSMTDTLQTFAEQVTTVAREVGTEGILGGQARVPGVSGTWKDLTDSVNFMASNLTTQVRGIAKVVTAVANGDLNQKLVLEAKGEVAALVDTINSMTDTLQIFADQVTTVAREVGTEGKLGGQAKVPNVAGTWKDLTDNVNFMANSLTVQVRAISDVATAVAQGDLTRSITVDAQGEVSTLKDNVNQMIANLKATTEQNTAQDWLKTNLARFSSIMQGQKTLESVARLIMSELTPLVDAHTGVFYMNDGADGAPSLKLLSSFAYQTRKNLANRFGPGEGLVGQCALEKKSILLTNVPSDYIHISSGLGEAAPLNIIVLPVLFEGEIMAVIELGSFQRFSEIHRTFLDQLMESIGVVLNMISANMRTEELLKQSQSLTQELQSQSQELQSQQDQLRRTNVELETQAKELEDKAAQLAEQNTKVELKNREVELARIALEEKAEQLALSSKYKSEFLANMSHELRTPLNSMLILAKLMADNPDGNLTTKQRDFASTIHASGEDLLNLINEILDLSKIEAGKMEIEVTRVSLLEVQDYVERTFRHVAEQKGLGFRVNLDPTAPFSLNTDMQRLQQVLRNLLGNAFKFTEKGEVTLRIGHSDRDMVLDNGLLYPASELIAFSVSDTGIGIPRDKQQLIFQAFQQADGTTSRKFGGTGLGLSISREITRLLGGRIGVESQPGQGSTFALYLPMDHFANSPLALNALRDEPSTERRPLGYAPSTPAPTPARLVTDSGTGIRSAPSVVVTADDDRASIRPGDRVLLLIEDDVTFAGILLDVARKQGFKTLVAYDGHSGLELAERYRPDAISLDLKLPDVDGWNVLDQLKRNPNTRHIPVQVISVMDRQKGTAMGAISYLEKPVTGEALEGAFAHIKGFIDREVRELLIVEDDPTQRTSIVELMGEGDLKITAVGSGEEALEVLEKHSFDCLVLDLSLPDMGGFEVLKRIRRQNRLKDLPVIIYTGKDLSKQEESQLKKYAQTIISKGAASSEHLLDETSFFLHRIVEKLPPTQREIVEKRHRESQVEATKSNGNGRSKRKTAAPATPTVKDGSLTGHKVLVVDDDVRNIFALTSVLESQGLQVLFDESGKDAIQTLVQTPDIEIVLMDVMMPEMDGFETMQRIREIETLKDIPIIALTAKAMEGDREKCLAAGANDYITKPVNTDALFEMLRAHLGVAA